MNYLSHYYLFHPVEKPGFVTGLILPDLTRTAHKKFRLKVDFNHLPESFLAIEEGVQLHFKTDRIFHKAPFFKEHTAQIKKIALQHRLDALSKYLSFFAHLVFEMMIDKILMQQHPKLIDTFYTCLQKTNRELIEQYLHHKNKSEFIPAFNTFYDLFLNKQFLRNYIKPNGLAQSILRVYNHTTHLHVSPKLQQLAPFLKATEVYLQPVVEDIFVTVQQQLKQ